REQRRDVLRGGLVFEPVYIIFLGETVGRTSLIAEQVAHGVVVLAMGETPHHRGRIPIRGFERDGQQKNWQLTNHEFLFILVSGLLTQAPSSRGVSAAPTWRPR